MLEEMSITAKDASDMCSGLPIGFLLPKRCRLHRKKMESLSNHCWAIQRQTERKISTQLQTP